MSKQLTVKELIQKLKEVKNQDLPINTQGCDCVGDYCGVAVEKDRVYITRDNDE